MLKSLLLLFLNYDTLTHTHTQSPVLCKEHIYEVFEEIKNTF